MASTSPPVTPHSTTPTVHRFDRLHYEVVRLLVRLSNALDRFPPIDVRADGSSASHEPTLVAILDQLGARGILGSRDDHSNSSEIKLASTGSDMNVAIIPGDATGGALVLKFTDSVVASAELVKSSDIQTQLTSDVRLASWSSYIPRVLASGTVGATTFAVEQCLSSRDGRAVDDDPAATNALIADALTVINRFHRLSARTRQVDDKVLAAVVDRPMIDLRANTPAGIFRSRASSIDRLAAWLRQSLVGLDFEVGWTHGDYHLGNVLIDDLGNHVVGVVDWGRAESDGLTVLDGFTLIVLERAKSAGKEISPFLLELLKDCGVAQSERSHSDALGELRALLPGESKVDLRCLLMLTWLKHVANNLKNEDRTRSHGLWRLRTVDLLLYGAIEIVGF
ncbi:MAG TPA: aminoglycoside phosphotransferase family protein [Acidimicrobiales bacterium]